MTALALPAAPVAAVASWSEAAAVTRRPDWSHAWWQAEDQLRDRLYAAARTRLGEERLLAALGPPVDAAREVLLGAAAVAATRAGTADPALTRVAAGAASQACYQAALAALAEVGPAGAFAVKLRLFLAGRWPLGIVGGQFFMF